jgi:hypothetical protein
MSATRYAVMMLRFADIKDRPKLDMGLRRSVRGGASGWMAY